LVIDSTVVCRSNIARITSEGVHHLQPRVLFGQIGQFTMVEGVIEPARRTHEAHWDVEIHRSGIANHAHERDHTAARSNQKDRATIIFRPGKTSNRTPHLDLVAYAETSNQLR
jgi:hypothetical protein